MSLADAVKDIADQMEAESKTLAGNVMDAGPLLSLYVRLLRSALKASEQVAQPISSMTDHLRRVSTLQPSPAELLATAIEQQVRQKRISDAEESSPCFVECVGGGSDGVMVNIPSEMPEGSHTRIAGQVYTKKSDGKLHYNEEMTSRK